LLYAVIIVPFAGLGINGNFAIPGAALPLLNSHGSEALLYPHRVAQALQHHATRSCGVPAYL
jgi:hypothetical protein